MISISFDGTTRRPVISIGPWTLKIARGPEGRRCNQYEADLFGRSPPRRRQLLCPVRWVSPDGLLLVMATARRLNPSEFDQLSLATLVMTEWDHLPGEDGNPFELKADDWGKYKGRLVAVDYSALA